LYDRSFWSRIISDLSDEKREREKKRGVRKKGEKKRGGGKGMEALPRRFMKAKQIVSSRQKKSRKEDLEEEEHPIQIVRSKQSTSIA